MLEDNTPSSYGTNRINPSYFDDPQHSKIAPLMCPLKGNDSHYDMPPYQTYSVYYYKSRSEEHRTVDCTIILSIQNSTFLKSDGNVVVLPGRIASKSPARVLAENSKVSRAVRERNQMNCLKAWLSSRTLCMLASTEKGRMYDVRSVYGLQQSIATRKALHEVTSKRSTVLTGFCLETEAESLTAINKCLTSTSCLILSVNC
ncbi:unnamed protein product [Anisakis simplex]|uniref:Uncharacterized protein n=1 Tax=Anisakis simplex TaxID=6269 RepID=A0A0M3J8C3_ANISI|nr:unnamed protein product [Anisakis simplex]